jgi:hypothetical protein
MVNMALTTKEIKQRYFNKKWREAPKIQCACGCGEFIKSVDRYGRPVRFVNGHNGRKYEDPREHKREYCRRNREPRYQYKISRGHKLKARLIKLKSSKCQDCGTQYNGKNGSIFHFHHLDASTKLFNIGGKLTVLAWSKILEEVKKCVMICGNCHALRHCEEY